jgi:hypothetical protein
MSVASLVKRPDPTENEVGRMSTKAAITKLRAKPDPKKNVMADYYSPIKNVVVPGGLPPSGFVPELYRDPEALYDFINAGDTRRALATLEANASNPGLLGAMVGLCRERSGMKLKKFTGSKDVLGIGQRLDEIVESYKGSSKYALFEMAYHTNAPTARIENAAAKAAAATATASTVGAGPGLSRRTRNTRRRNYRKHKRSSRRR